MKALAPAVLNDLRTKFGDTVTSADLQAYGWSVVNAVRGGALPRISKGLYSLRDAANQPASNEVKVDRAAVAAKIRERFNALEILSEGVITNNVRALIVAGAPGVGKTYTLDQKLRAASAGGRIQTHTEVKGSISAIGLFLTLWENREAGQIIVMDDIDSVFGDEECMNLLKGALDSSDRRVISWIKDSNFLKDRDIPNSFEFEGQVVFITNYDIEALIDRGSKMAPHLSALLSRSVFLDLAIHTKEAVMIRIEQILEETDFARKNGLRDSQVVEVMAWLKEHAPQLRQLSLRTVIQLASFIRTTADWKTLAKVTLCRSR